MDATLIYVNKVGNQIGVFSDNNDMMQPTCCWTKFKHEIHKFKHRKFKHEFHQKFVTTMIGYNPHADGPNPI